MFVEREPEWNSETINRRVGETTFKQCGWCEYRSTGVHRYDCMLEGGCKLLKWSSSDKYFDSECKLILLGYKDIDCIIKSKETEIFRAEELIKSINCQIDILIRLDSPDNMPCLPEHRNHDHFNINDEIMVYIRDEEGESAIIKSGWLKGKVIIGYRHHDGCVSVYTDKKYHNGDFLDGHGLWMGVSIPLIMLKSEYSWFVSNPTRFFDWIKLSCEGRKFNSTIINWNSIFTPREEYCEEE